MRRRGRGGGDGRGVGTDGRAERHVARDIGGYAAERKKEKEEEDEGAFVPSFFLDAWQNAGHKFTESELESGSRDLDRKEEEKNTYSDIHPAGQPRKKPSQTHERDGDRESKDGGGRVVPLICSLTDAHSTSIKETKEIERGLRRDGHGWASFSGLHEVALGGSAAKHLERHRHCTF